MTDRLTTEEIQDLRAKSAAATKGPWRIDDNYDLWPEVRAEDSSLAAECLSWDNGKLIATMRNTLDRLLDELLEHREREASIRRHWLDCFASIQAAKETDR